MKPQSEAELSQIIRTAQAPFRIRGGGTRPVGHAVSGAPLETGGFSGIELYEPGALTLVVGAGTPLEQVTAALDVEGQRLAFEPIDHRGLLGTDGTPTIGGVVAANVSGPRRIQAGACRDFMLGVRFVDGHGTAISNGGRVMKNVTGYDLVKLMAGSFGTLGVLTQVSLKVLPKPAATGTLRIEGLNDSDAIKALSRALASPFEVTGAAHLPGTPDGIPATLIRVEGSEGSVAYRMDRLQEVLNGFGAAQVETDPGCNAEIWADIRDATPFHGRDGNVWRLSVKPTDAPGIVKQLPGCEALYDWGGGLIWLLAPTGGVTGEAIRKTMATGGGHATLIRGRDDQVFQPLSPALAAIHQGLRQKFDPNGLLNPGLMEGAA